MKKETKIFLAIMAVMVAVGGLVIVFSRQKARVINDLLPEGENYDGVKKIRKGTRIYINADDTLARMTINNGKIEPASYFMKKRDFEKGEYVGKYLGRYGEYAHLVQGNNSFKHIYLIHNARIK